uniref:Uncharacterized protein n=1 Tax=viral metagenome TaxID=1070528 RepID=A0A6M3ISC7_9ZZZZ
MKEKTAKRLMRTLDRKRALNLCFRQSLKVSDNKLIRKCTAVLLKEKDNG